MENEFYTTPEVDSEVAAPVEAPVAKKSKKKLFIIGGIVIAAVIALILIFNPFGGGSNKPTTPLDKLMALGNAKSLKEQEKVDTTNGLFAKQLKKIDEIEKKAENYEETEDMLDDSIRNNVDENEESYGKNYKFYYEVEDKDAIKKTKLNEVKKQIKENAKAQLEAIKELKKDDDKVRSLAERYGLKKTQYKELLEIYEEIYKVLEDITISEGYEMDVKVLVKGSELDEPEEMEEDSGTYYVYKVNGKWVTLDALSFRSFTNL